MRFDKEKSCFVNDDGSRLDSSESICSWTERRYIRWLQDAVAASGRQTVDNTWQWKNGVKFATTCHK